jgi:ABC-2 type transport system ATP-binding protein
MQQRLSLARVLIHDPKALILDEPASGLDPRARIEIRELLLELKRMGKTIMISSHILSELEEICDHYGIIENGRLVFSGTSEEIARRMGTHKTARVTVAGDPQRAEELLSALPQVEAVTRAGAELVVRFVEGQLADGLIARTLVGGSVDVIAIVPERLRLDQAFLQLTRGIVH